jgi:hypothetical protein
MVILLSNFFYTVLINAVEQKKDVTVTVLVTPQYRTLKLGGNACSMAITGLYNGKPIVNSEELVGDVEWFYVGEKHTTEHDISINLSEPKAPQWSKSNTAEFNVITRTDGETTIEFTMKVRFKIHKKKSSGSNAQQGDFIRYSEEFIGVGVAKINGTNKNFQIMIVPKERFDGRSFTRLGVGELGNIYALNLFPIDPTVPNNVVQLIKVTSSDNEKFQILPKTTNNNLEYCPFLAKPPEPCTVTITVTASWRGVTSSESIDVDIVEPTGAGLVRVLSEKVFHLRNTCSTGFVGLYYYLPSDVSFLRFVNLGDIYEGDCEQENASGYFTDRGNNIPHKGMNFKIDLFNRLESGISSITLKPNSRIYDPINRPYETKADYPYAILPLAEIRAGQMEWNIPICYINFYSNSQFENKPLVVKKCTNTVKQFIEIRDNGNIRITKSEGYSESDVNDEEYKNSKWDETIQYNQNR